MGTNISDGGHSISVALKHIPQYIRRMIKFLRSFEDRTQDREVAGEQGESMGAVLLKSMDLNISLTMSPEFVFLQVEEYYT